MEIEVKTLVDIISSLPDPNTCELDKCKAFVINNNIGTDVLAITTALLISEESDFDCPISFNELEFIKKFNEWVLIIK